MRKTPPTIDILPSCANAAFVEFASAQYRHLNPEWSFFAAVSRYFDQLAPDLYDFIIFDCPPAIGYQSMNAVFAADVLYVPSGPGYWEYDSTTSFIGQLSEALEDLDRFSGNVPAGTMNLPKAFVDLRFLLTRFETSNELHGAMQQAFIKVFGDRVAEHPIELTRAVEQSGRFLSSIYEIDYRDFQTHMSIEQSGAEPEQSNVVPLKPSQDVPTPDISDGTEWALAQAILHQENPAQYSAWFAALKRGERIAGRVQLRAPTKFHAAYVLTHLIPTLTRACQSVDADVTGVEIIV